MDTKKQIEITIRCAQTAASVLDLMTCTDRTTAIFMLQQATKDFIGLRDAVETTFGIIRKAS